MDPTWCLALRSCGSCSHIPSLLLVPCKLCSALGTAGMDSPGGHLWLHEGCSADWEQALNASEIIPAVFGISSCSGKPREHYGRSIFCVFAFPAPMANCPGSEADSSTGVVGVSSPVYNGSLCLRPRCFLSSFPCLFDRNFLLQVFLMLFQFCSSVSVIQMMLASIVPCPWARGMRFGGRGTRWAWQGRVVVGFLQKGGMQEGRSQM